MIKKNLLTLFTILINFSIFPQNQFNAGASFNIGFPTGSFAELAKTGVGGSIIGEYTFSENVSALMSVSYHNFPGNVEKIAYLGSTIDFSVNAIPILAGVRYYFSPEFFGTLEAGANFLRVTADIYNVYSEEKVSSDYQAKYCGGIGVGYRYRMAEASVLELSGIYQLVEDDLNSFTLQIGILVLLNNI